MYLKYNMIGGNIVRKFQICQRISEVLTPRALSGSCSICIDNEITVKVVTTCRAYGIYKILGKTIYRIICRGICREAPPAHRRRRV